MKRKSVLVVFACWLFAGEPALGQSGATGSSPACSARRTSSNFGLYAGWVADIDTATLTSVVNFLTAQKIPIELEAPSLQATASCVSNVEGYVPYGQSLTTFTDGYLQRRYGFQQYRLACARRAQTLARAQTFASTSGSAPDFVFFQSWDPYPQYCLPETDPTTFTGVVKAYVDTP